MKESTYILVQKPYLPKPSPFQILLSPFCDTQIFTSHVSRMLLFQTHMHSSYPFNFNFPYIFPLPYSCTFFFFSSRFISPPQGSIFRSENDIYSPPRFSTPIVAILPSFFPIFHLLYPFISPILIFFPLSSFFFYIFCLFLLAFSYFFPQMTLAAIFPIYSPLSPPPPGYR